jgi:hypothetical protein
MQSLWKAKRWLPLRKALFSRRHMIVHNIGDGPKMEDALFNWKITGHYRYFGPSASGPVPGKAE